MTARRRGRGKAAEEGGKREEGRAERGKEGEREREREWTDGRRKGREFHQLQLPYLSGGKRYWSSTPPSITGDDLRTAPVYTTTTDDGPKALLPSTPHVYAGPLQSSTQWTHLVSSLPRCQSSPLGTLIALPSPQCIPHTCS